MNLENHGTLAACKRLAKAGIMLETESVWTELPNLYITNPDGSSPVRWEIISHEEYHKIHSILPSYPAPSMIEVWRELPIDEFHHLLFYLHGISWLLPEEEVFFSYKDYKESVVDTLIDLLIWVRYKRKEIGG